MARIFISYSRVDSAFVAQLYLRLQQMRPAWHIWYDQAPHGLLGGDSWWDALMKAVAAADIFIYVLSNESVESKFCQAEFEEARRLQKRIITIQARDRTKLQGDLVDIQYVDMKNGVDDPDALAQLSGSLDRQAALIRRHLPKWQPRTVKPTEDVVPTRTADAPPVDTPTLQLPAVERRVPQPKAGGKPSAWVYGLLLAAIGLLAVLVIPSLLANNGGTPTPTLTAAALAPTTEAPTVAETLPATEAPTETPMPTETPTEIDIAQVVGTLDAQATDSQATLYVQETAAARATAYAVGTQSILDQTATAAAWTDTPTPDITASIDAYRTQQSETAIAALTATAASWTDTPTPTYTPSDTPTPTSTPTSTPTATPTLTPLEAALQRATSFSGSNTDWEPFVHAFPDDPAGAEMVLVPVGSFTMGSRDGADDERPEHAQVITAPYWIDRTEVTRGQYARCVAADVCTDTPDNGYSQRDTQPINRVTWFQARDYCAWRGMRLPTEVEWEYAARGPAGWVYPWGDAWNEQNAVYSGNSSGLTADVGSRPAGASWVGALDLSGNVWEWVSSLSMDYPYNASHESSTDTNSARVLRGGSFVDNSDVLRAANRGRLNPDIENNNFGFRCALP